MKVRAAAQVILCGVTIAATLYAGLFAGVAHLTA